MRLYHYTKLNTFIRWIFNPPTLNESYDIKPRILLKFGNLENTNDPFEFGDYFTYPDGHFNLWLSYNETIKKHFHDERVK